MEIAKGIIDNYLRRVTVHWFDPEDLPAENINQYRPLVENIILEARLHNDFQPLRLGLDYLLCHPEISLEDHGYRYPWDDADVREIIHYIRKTVFPDAKALNCDEVKDVKLIPMSREDWWKMRIAQGLHPDLSKRAVK